MIDLTSLTPFIFLSQLNKQASCNLISGGVRERDIEISLTVYDIDFGIKFRSVKYNIQIYGY